MLRVTPIYGSRWSAKGQAEEPACTLVEYGGCRVLWNIGWTAVQDASSSSSQSGPQFPELPPHDCLILTDSTLQACGGLPLYQQQMESKSALAGAASAPPPIYATFPTVKMGQMALYDQHAAVCLDGGLAAYTLQDVDNVFSRVTAIKYSQTMTVYNPATGQADLSVTAHRAGGTVGGAFYVLQRLQDETVVVLTSKYHISRELHLDSATLLKHGSTPDVLVTGAGGPACRQLKSLAAHNKMKPQTVRQVEQGLVENILSVLRRDGNVLLPTDASGRVLELVLLLNDHWERHRYQAAYNLVWLGPMVTNTAEFARCQLEWMGTGLGQQFDSCKGHPYNLKNVRFCASMAELEAVMEENQNPSCVLASGLNLEGGPARDVLLKWADNPDNAVIFTDSSQAYLRRQAGTSAFANGGGVDASTVTLAADGNAVSALDAMAVTPEATVATLTAVATALPTVAPEDDAGEEAAGMVGSAVTEQSEWTTAGQLLSAWAKAKAAGREMDDVVAVDVNVPNRAPLVGPELKAFLASEESARVKQMKEEEKQAMMREVELAKGQLRLGEEDTGGLVPSEAKASGSSSAATGTASRPRKKSRFDSTLFMKFSKPLHLTFEIREEAVGLGQSDSTAKYGIGESVGRSGEVLEDDYGIAVLPERFTDIVSGVDPSKFAGGSGRIGEDVMRRGFGYGVDSSRSKGKPSAMGLARVSEDEDQSDSDDMDEQALEAVDLSEGNGIVRGRNGRPPTKVSTIPRLVEVLAEVSFVPLEGRVNAQAAHQSVRALQPRQVVVLGGPAQGEKADGLVDEVTLLAKAAASFATGNKHVHTPSDGETAELDVGHAAFAVRLINNPYVSPEEMEVEEEPPAPVEPFEARVGACTVSLLDLVATGQKVALDGSIVLAPRASSVDKNPSVYVSDGEVLLTDLRAELIAQGMKAEYTSKPGYAQLVVNERVVVKKTQDGGRMSVEGPLCKDFYTVRSVVCSQYVNL